MSIANELTQQKGSIDDLAKLPQALIMQMAQKGQIREDMLAPILGLKAEMADAFARNEALKNAGQIPPTVMEQLLAKNAMAEQGQMPQMPQMPQQMMPPQMPSQQMMPPQQMMAQQMPQSIEDAGLAQLPIPEREYAGGGIVAFQNNPDQPVSSNMPATSDRSAAMEDYYNFRDYIKNATGPNEYIIQKLKEVGSYFTKPRQSTMSPGDADIQPGYTPSTYVNVPQITMGPRKPPTAAPNVGINTPPPPPPQDNSLAEALKEIRAGIAGDANERKAARKEARDMRMLEGSLGILGGESPYAFVNLGKGPMSAIKGYGEDIKGLRAEELDRRKQLSGLGLKGIELKQAEKELAAKMPLYGAQTSKDLAMVDYYKAKARNPYGVAGLGGTVTPNVTEKIMNSYRALASNPKSDPAFFASLDEKTRMALNTKVGSASYNRGMEEVARIANEKMERDLDFIASRNRKSPTFSTTE